MEDVPVVPLYALAEVYAEARRHFGEKELVDLTIAIIAINGWNRLAVPFRAETGSYRPKAATPA